MAAMMGAHTLQRVYFKPKNQQQMLQIMISNHECIMFNITNIINTIHMLFIEITENCNVAFVFQLQVNPKFLVMESDFTNNVVRCNIHYTGRYVTTNKCKIVQ